MTKPTRLTDEATGREFLLTNYTMAAGRIGLAAIFVPLLAGVAVLFLLDEHGSSVIAGGLILLCMPFLWYALRVPLSVRIGDVLQVRYLLVTREYGRDEITGVDSGTILTHMGPTRLLPGWELGLRRIPIATISTSSGKRIAVRAGITDVDRLCRALTGW